MLIKVFGSGCPTCKKLLERVKQSVKDLDLSAQVEYVTDYTKMMEIGLMSIPALMIDDKVVVSGRLPSLEEIKDFLK